MSTIAIKHARDGKITHRFIGNKDSGEWIITQASDWPEPNPSDNEIAVYYYDEATGEISVQYQTVTRPDDPDA
jgi:hypothetical protein